MKNEIYFRVDAEYHLRAKLLEAENYRMLNQLRKRCPGTFSLRWQTIIDNLGRTWIATEEKLDKFGSSLVTLFDFEGRLDEDPGGIS